MDAQRVELLEALHDATKKYMQHKNNTASGIQCDSQLMEIRMIFRKDVLSALEALEEYGSYPAG